MGKLLRLCLILAIAFSCSGPRVRVLHYNIKELSSAKIQSEDAQFEAVREVLAMRSFDILSVNEIQYDLPGVPSKKYTSKGMNLGLLAKKVGDGIDGWNQSFNLANTGLGAVKKKDGSYGDNPASALDRSLADQVNFGVFPAQYSTGMLGRYPIKSELVVRELSWRSFNKNIDLSRYRAGDGRPLPEDMALFDKNFSDVTIDVEGRDLHVILLHAVPSYHFGNKLSPNYVRNQDQLRFLEWYVTGKTDIEIGQIDVKPLESDDLFIIVGDLNASIYAKDSLGGEVLRRMRTKLTMWMSNPLYTNEGDGFSSQPFRLMLDYLFVSPRIKVLQGQIIQSSTPRRQLGCSAKTPEVQLSADEVLVRYDLKGQTCFAAVTKLDERLKKASDHFPIWAELQLP